MKKNVCCWDLEGPISVLDFAAEIGRLLSSKKELGLQKYDMGEFFFMISNYDGTGTYPVLIYEGLGGATWGPNNKLAYTKLVDGVSSIYTINIDGTDEFRVTDESFGNISSWINWSPDGQTLVFPYNNDIWEIGIDGNGLKQITDDEYTDTYAVFSPNGLTIAYTSVREGQEEIFLIGLNL